MRTFFTLSGEHRVAYGSEFLVPEGGKNHFTLKQKVVVPVPFLFDNFSNDHEL